MTNYGAYKPKGKESEERQKPKQPWKPKSLQEEKATQVCPYCGGAVKAGDAMCSHCGRSLIVGTCSFCGAMMKPNAKFCTRCGQSREGVTCPECGTLNSRNFCRKCNAPLTPGGMKAMEDAKNDPKFLAIQAKARELAEIHARIKELDGSSTPGLSADDRALLDEYADLLSALGTVTPFTPEPKPRTQSKPKPLTQSTAESEQKPAWELNIMSLDELMKAYTEKVDQMNQALAEMAPPPEYSPEQQRDYYAARKIATIETEIDMSGYNSTMWKCNFCGCLHTTPSDCMRPELGGTWLYITPEEYIDKNPQVKKYTGKLNIS